MAAPTNYVLVERASISVWVVDDHEVVRRGVIAAIQELAPDIEVKKQASSTQDLDFSEETPDAVLLDIELNDGRDPVSNVLSIVSHDVPVLLFTAETRRPIPLRALISAGARGLALKVDPAAELIDALRAVAAGQFATTSHLADRLLHDDALTASLTKRELEVLEALANGIPKKAIGHSIDAPLSAHTVDTYFQRIAARYEAIGRPVSNIYGSLREATRDGYFDL